MKKIILLHGAAGSMEQCETIAGLLSSSCKVYCMNFSGHGGEPFAGDGKFSITGFAEEAAGFMLLHNIERASIFGYSMGGYVGMYLARLHADKIDKLVTLGTKFYWDAVSAEKETGLLDPEKISAKLPAFANTLQQRHSPNDWKIVLKKTAAMLLEMGNHPPLADDDYAAVKQPVLLMQGDRDKMVPLEETIAVYRKLPAARLCILQDTPHPIEQIDTERLYHEIRLFLQ